MLFSSAMLLSYLYLKSPSKFFGHLKIGGGGGEWPSYSIYGGICSDFCTRIFTATNWNQEENDLVNYVTALLWNSSNCLQLLKWSTVFTCSMGELWIINLALWLAHHKLIMKISYYYYYYYVIIAVIRKHIKIHFKWGKHLLCYHLHIGTGC